MNIFVSYSPLDHELVATLVSLLCQNNSALSYCDADSMRASGRWREELGKAISSADVVLVFWCHHANTSYELRKEFALALAAGKDVLPLLLDATPLPGQLAGRRCLDLRSHVAAIHEDAPGDPALATESGQADVDRQIATGLARKYEELLVLRLARDIEAELATRL